MLPLKRRIGLAKNGAPAASHQVRFKDFFSSLHWTEKVDFDNIRKLEDKHNSKMKGKVTSQIIESWLLKNKQEVWAKQK